MTADNGDSGDWYSAEVGREMGMRSWSGLWTVAGWWSVRAKRWGRRHTCRRGGREHSTALGEAHGGAGGQGMLCGGGALLHTAHSPCGYRSPDFIFWWEIERMIFGGDRGALRREERRARAVLGLDGLVECPRGRAGWRHACRRVGGARRTPQPLEKRTGAQGARACLAGGALLHTAHSPCGYRTQTQSFCFLGGERARVIFGGGRGALRGGGVGVGLVVGAGGR